MGAKDIVADAGLVARCGLYCGACGAYLHGRCPGCAENHRAGWCKVRACCAERGFSSCADCKDFESPSDCAKFNNVISRIFSFIFRSDRAACIRQIREKGLDGHACEMARQRRHSVKRA